MVRSRSSSASWGSCGNGIAAKRYVVYRPHPTDPTGEVEIVKRSEHGLGSYLDPRSPREDRRDAGGNRLWITEAWRWILTAHHDSDTALPEWSDLPALSRVTVSSPPLWRPFTRWNHDRIWADQMKPFNFLLVATIDPFGFLEGTDPARFRLIAPTPTTPPNGRPWTGATTTTPHGPTYRITTDRSAPARPDTVVVKSYGDVLREYRLHPEHKFHGSDGQPCRRLTRGVLARRPVYPAGAPHLIGKESNRLDDVHAGLIGHHSEVIIGYDDPTTTLHDLVLPVLDRYSGRQLAGLAGTDRRTIDRIRRGHQHPRPDLTLALTRLAAHVAGEDLTTAGHLPADNHLPPHPSQAPTALLAAWRHLIARAATE